MKDPTTKDIYRICKKYKIYKEKDYNNLKSTNQSINFKDNIYDYPGFKWQKILDPHKNKYYDKKKDLEEAIEKVFDPWCQEKKLNLEESDKSDIDLDILDEILEEEFSGIGDYSNLNKYDNKIPPIQKALIDHFY